ncbi:MAG: GNAT family N-acetyltransferase [Saprospiraceae bacterium]|nr:GNAT family N-acetyltransferase [Saprospiraceae bacterium]
MNLSSLENKAYKIYYEPAGDGDASIIAELHTRSWQRHYRGIYSDFYLDEQVEKERHKIWRKRFAERGNDSYIIKAVHEGTAIGFACTFLDYDQEFGALVDNLHVLEKYQGLGIGRQLLGRSAKWVQKMDSETGIYLYVLDQNLLAKSFYQRLGASMSEILFFDSPDGKKDEVIRCSWNTLELMEICGI